MQFEAMVGSGSQIQRLGFPDLFAQSLGQQNSEFAIERSLISTGEDHAITCSSLKTVFSEVNDTVKE
jgi:hypothetical protein